MVGRSSAHRALAAALALACAASVLAVPLGYRYVGSRLVSEGRVVLWYWNADRVEVDPHRVSFVARLYARAPDVSQEREFVAIVRCDSKTYRNAESRGPYEVIDSGEPIEAVWRAGCDQGKALDVAQRNARMNGVRIADTPLARASPIDAAAPAPARPPIVLAQNPATKAEPADPRRVDACVKFAETRARPAGDASITNTCTFAVEVTLCYKGASGGPFDCPARARGKHGDSLPPGATHALPEYRRGMHKGINLVACRGEVGSVFPKLDDAAGKSGCF